MFVKRALRGAILAIAVFAVTAGTAAAATVTIGPTNLGGPGSAWNAGAAVLNNTADTAGSVQVVPATGVVTTWRVRMPAGGGQARLLILRPTSTTNQYDIVGASSIQIIPAGISSYTVNLPVVAGDRIALDTDDTVLGRFDAAARYSYSFGHPAGTTITQTPDTNPANTYVNLFNADVEIAAANVPPPLPIVAGLSSSSGSVDGGETITITGENFTSGSSVTFGGVPATSVTVDIFNRLTVVVPPHDAGAVDVRVTTAVGTSPVVDADAYTYIAPPVVEPVPEVVVPQSAPSTSPVTKKPTTKKTTKKSTKKKAKKKASKNHSHFWVAG